MKGDLLEIFLDSFGWVLGKASLFAGAVVTGGVIGASSLVAGTSVATRSLGLPDISMVTLMPLLLQGIITFWVAMWYVRSENAGLPSWGVITGLQALGVAACFTRGLPAGWLAPTVTWVLCLTMIGMMGTALWYFHQWRLNRWAAQLVELEAANAQRRAELKSRFGTESAGIRETGL